ncbi:MAG: hypothetical protein Q8S00_00495 [Deltaproteobacteria bacterium]|nr:hypothetical protein [Deltaproteobacteria bacterium]MDZ4343894.1 DUF1302 family protein [Candidatus Binatia bacterium]
MSVGRTVSLILVILLMVLVRTAPVRAASILGDDWEKFFRDKVSFAGYLENVTGLSIAAGDSKFTTSNRFIMNRLTFQPEFNVDFNEQLRFFISWRFAKEPRYNKEAKDRRRSTPPFPPLDNTFYDEDSFKPWEMIIDIKPTDQLKLRWGRQFISWGETDGVRLLDVINPQDGTFPPPLAPNLFNLDETRIPRWGLRAFYTPFPATNTTLELIAMPGFDEEKKRVDEYAPIAARWTPHPETRIRLGRLFADPIAGNLPVVIPLATSEFPDAGDNWKLGGRITHTFGRLSAGIGYIWGYNPQAGDMVFRKVGAPFLLGPPGPGTPTGVRLKLINDRTSIYAAHFNYALEEPWMTAIRGELAFYPSKPYNISQYPGSTGLKAGPHPKYSNTDIVEKHTLRYSLGFDRPTFIPFLHPDDPWRAFNLSLQVVQSIIFDHEDGIRAFASAEKIHKVSTSITFRIGTGYLGDTIFPDVFVAYDPLGYWSANPAVSYVPPWNEKIRITLTAALYGGRNKFGSLGVFSEKDSVFLKMRYQF